jgi:hypothetical protein
MSAVIIKLADARKPSIPIPSSAAGYSFYTIAHSDKDYDTLELFRVDPDAEFEDGCLIVIQIKGAGGPMATRWNRRGRDGNGRFIRPGDPEEHFNLGFGISYTKRNASSLLRKHRSGHAGAGLFHW